MKRMYLIRYCGGSRLATLLLSLLVALALHASAATASAADSIYWTAEGAGTIRVANLDGTGSATTLFGSEASPCGVAIDPAAGKIYWTNFWGGLRVANLDGTVVPLVSPKTLFDAGASLCGVAINPATNKIYWADFGNDKIRVGNLDGTGTAMDMFGTGDAPSGVAIDPAAGKIYWTDQFADIVEFANLDGSGSPVTLFGPSGDDDNPIGLAIDTAAGKIYWTALSSGKVRVGNQDGSGFPSTLFGSETSPGGVAIDAGAGKIYWDSFTGGAIRVGNLDGSVVPLVSPKTLFGGEGSPLLAALLRAPEGTGAPTISGGTQFPCAQLTCSQGSWAPDLLGAFLFRAPRLFAYQWQKDGNDILLATMSTFSPTEAGDYTCRVTATNQAGSTPQTSAPTTVTACDDGLFCNGTETCTLTVCMPGTNPCLPLNTTDNNCAASCNEADGNCTASDPVTTGCNDGLFCNGTDTCNASGSCANHTGDPCLPLNTTDNNCAASCNEADGNCTASDPVTTGCNDGLFCNGTDTCNGGSCMGHAGNPCTGHNVGPNCNDSCNEAADNCMANDTNGTPCPGGSCVVGTCFVVPPPTTTSTTVTGTTTTATGTTTTTLLSCGSTPASGCQAAASLKGLFVLRDATPDDHDQLKFKWTSSAAVAGTAFGSPTTVSSYALCLYDTTGRKLGAAAPAGGTCAGKPCWRASGTGFKYADKEATPDGLSKMSLKPGDAGKAKISVSGKGLNLAMPTLPLTTPVKVQVIRSGASTCWEATFTTPAVNQSDRFTGKSD